MSGCSDFLSFIIDGITIILFQLSILYLLRRRHQYNLFFQFIANRGRWAFEYYVDYLSSLLEQVYLFVYLSVCMSVCVYLPACLPSVCHNIWSSNRPWQDMAGKLTPPHYPRHITQLPVAGTPGDCQMNLCVTYTPPGESGMNQR